MVIFAFRSERSLHQVALTEDAAGANLPADLAPWYSTDQRDMAEVLGLADSVRAAVKVKGYILVDVGPPPKVTG
jgi:hypothetical protein